MQQNGRAGRDHPRRVWLRRRRKRLFAEHKHGCDRRNVVVTAACSSPATASSTAAASNGNSLNASG